LQAAKVLIGRHINRVPVMGEAGKLVGILYKSDLIAQQKSLNLTCLPLDRTLIVSPSETDTTLPCHANMRVGIRHSKLSFVVLFVTELFAS
jgi:CBS domain-containing protein